MGDNRGFPNYTGYVAEPKTDTEAVIRKLFPFSEDYADRANEFMVKAMASLGKVGVSRMTFLHKGPEIVKRIGYNPFTGREGSNSWDYQYVDLCSDLLGVSTEYTVREFFTKTPELYDLLRESKKGLQTYVQHIVTTVNEAEKKRVGWKKYVTTFSPGNVEALVTESQEILKQGGFEGLEVVCSTTKDVGAQTSTNVTANYIKKCADLLQSEGVMGVVRHGQRVRAIAKEEKEDYVVDYAKGQTNRFREDHGLKQIEGWEY